MNRELVWLFAKISVFSICLLPFLFLFHDAVNETLGPDPIETLHFRTGDWTLRFLLITLTLTPLKLLFNWKFQLRFRRMLGLFAFFYASLHFCVYFVLDLSLSWTQIVEEVPQNPYVLVGLSAYILLIPLAATSTRTMVQRLGRNWKKLHRLVYAAACLGVFHFLWLVKADLTEPSIYALILGILLGIRIFDRVRKQRPAEKSTAVLRTIPASESCLNPVPD
ncbi:MAG: sulfoxide reductase heme-binding subunit YedZ [Methylococcaceae bacterium]|nr:sulfoxide reductase heme-binding subunit YedZ [Methylococcaceae bacterium]MCI0733044.1 sulfoxide reductase heme-binding subunit YedZ [Methylococcaceae bacterium]